MDKYEAKHQYCMQVILSIISVTNTQDTFLMIHESTNIIRYQKMVDSYEYYILYTNLKSGVKLVISQATKYRPK